VAPSLWRACALTPSSVLWATPTPAPLSPTSRVIPAYKVRRSQSTPMLAFHRSLTAGEETGLSCSHDGYPSVPRPLRHRVLRCCISKLFTPSMAFAHGHQARLPVGPFRGKSSRRGRLRFMLRTRGLHSPIEPAPGSWGSSTPRVDAQSLPPRRRGSPRTPAGCYKGGLVPPLAGLSPASLRELPGRTVRQIFVLVAGQYPSAADQAAGVHLCRQGTATLGVSMFTPPHVIPAKPAPAQAGGRNPEAPRL